MAESNGSLPRHLQAEAKNGDQRRNPTLGNRVWATFFTVLLAKGRIAAPAPTTPRTTRAALLL